MELQIVSVPYRYDEREEGLGAGPSALLAAGLVDRLTAAGVACAGPVAAELPEAEREPGRTAVNIGKLGGQTAALVAAARRAGRGVLGLVGDDTAAVGVVAGVQQADGPIGTGLVWVDAHGDFNTPETSYSGILAGMPTAVIAGLAGPLWREAAGLQTPIPTDRILLVGVRELDEKEEGLLRATDVRIVWSRDLESEELAGALDRLVRRCIRLCVHIDVDVLDPRFVPSASTPAANGLTIEQTAAVVRAVLATNKVATLCVGGINPGAGSRGRRSVASALALLEQALPAWQATPVAE